MRAIPALAITQQAAVPKVVGVVRPMILFPASALSGLSQAELEMILSHELAHVRRHDVWINLLQRLAEAVLFFNPALWYLSRRISMLRECCCDTLACTAASDARDSDRRVQYAAALLHVVELMGDAKRQRQIAVLAVDGRSPSELRRRVAYLFGEPIHQPLRLSRGGLAAVASTLLILITALAVWTARVETQNARTAAAPDERPSFVKSNRTIGFATVSGRILVKDGAPFRGEGTLACSSEGYGINLEQLEVTEATGEFTTDVPIWLDGEIHRVFLICHADGYAPVGVGPMVIQPGRVTEGVTVVLKPGFSKTVAVTGEGGQAIAGASVRAVPIINGRMAGGSREQRTDDRGLLQIDHLADTRHTFRVLAPGFQPLRTDVQVNRSAEPIRLAMEPSRPTLGIVINPDRTPAVGAKLRAVCAVSDERHEIFSDADPGSHWGEVFATTDEQGRFTLGQLATGSRYVFIVEGSNETRLIVRDVRAGQGDLSIQLPQRRDLVVNIRGDLSGNEVARQPTVEVDQKIWIPTQPEHWLRRPIGGEIPVEVTEQGGRAVFRGLAIDPDPDGPQGIADAPEQFVEVTLDGYRQDPNQSVAIAPEGETSVRFVLDPPE